MDFETIVKSRYAVKNFDGKVISQEKVDKLFELIRLAPSSFNIQPWVVKVVTDKALKEKLQAAAWNQPQISTASHVLVFCANTDIIGNIHLLEKTMLAQGASAESIKWYVQMMQGFAVGLSAEHKLSWAQRQVYIALAHALLGAKALGFDACPMGFAADVPKPKVRFSKEQVFQ